MNSSRSKRMVVILDCCFGSAFVRGMSAKDSGQVNVLQQLGGKGRAVLTASNAVQYAFEQSGFELSLYSHFLVEGLTGGAADRDGDGWVSVDELHEYVREKVKETTEAMTPEIHPFEEGYKIFLAKSPTNTARLNYRKEVERLAKVNQGQFSAFTRRLLESKRLEENLSIADANAIEAEVLQPYREYERKRNEFESALTEEAQRHYPFSDTAQKEMEEFGQYLGLREDDIEEIKARLLGPRQAEIDRQQAQLRQQEQLKQQRLEQQRREQEQQEPRRREAEKLLQQELERSPQYEQHQKETEKLSRQYLSRARQSIEAKQQELVNQQPRPPHNNEPSLKTFEFQVGVLVKQVVESSESLDFWKKATVTHTIKSEPRQVQYFVEDLGKGIFLEMVAVPDGRFLMGSPEDEEGRSSSESPQHTVAIEPFFIGKFLVTQAQWRAIAQLPKVNVDLNSDPASFKGDTRPIERVSWFQAVEFCDRLSRISNRIYRLPSEAEWEYACRAEMNTPFHFGGMITTDLVNYNGDFTYGSPFKGQYRGQTTGVGSFSPNSFGLFDMHGNVFEWCADHWHENYQGAPEHGSVWIVGGNSVRRVIRGGSWLNNPWNCRSAFRLSSGLDDRYGFIGFRVVCAVPRTL